MAELVELQEGETLIGENEPSSDELRKQIEAANEDLEQPTEKEETPIEDAPVETPPEEDQEDEETIPEIPKETINEDKIYRKAQEDLLEALRSNQAKSKEPVKVLTPEEKLEALAKDPDAYLESKIAPYKEELKKVESQQALHMLRTVNPDFRRLEPLIHRIKDNEPEMFSGLSEQERWNRYYLLTKGLEAQNNERKAHDAEEKAAKKRLKEKQSASVLPKSGKKVSTETQTKSIDKMTSAEIAKEIRKLAV